MSLHRRYGALLLIIFCGLTAANEAKAAPLFCLAGPGLQPQCLYYSANDCRAKSERITQGACIVNPLEIEIPSGPGLWCMVTSSRYMQCHFDNLSSCEKSAKTKNAICVQTVKRKLLSLEERKELVKSKLQEQ